MIKYMLQYYARLQAVCKSRASILLGRCVSGFLFVHVCVLPCAEFYNPLSEPVDACPCQRASQVFSRLVMVVVWTAAFGLERVLTSCLISMVKGDAVFKLEENSPRVNMDAAIPFAQQGPSVDLNGTDGKSLLRRAGSKNVEDLRPVIM